MGFNDNIYHGMVCALVVPVVVMVVQCSHRMIRVVVTCNYVISHIVIDPTYQPIQSDGLAKKDISNITFFEMGNLK